MNKVDDKLLKKKRVKEMVDVIEEIPIEEAATMEEVVAEVADVQPEKPKRGRPKGSKNKAQKNADVPEEAEAPKPKRAAKRRPPSPQSRSPSPPKRRRAPVAELPETEHDPPSDYRQIAAEVLQILSTRHLDLRQAKREKYRTWFQ